MDDDKLEMPVLTDRDGPSSHQHQQQQPPATSSCAGDKKTTECQQLKPEDVGDISRSSISSVESVEVVHVRTPCSHSAGGSNGTGKRRRHSRTRTTIRYLRHGMLGISVALFIAGFLLTVLGFIDVNLTPVQRLPMQVVGPACLVATVAIALLGAIFLRLWRAELRRQRREIELRTRAQLQAMAADLLKKRPSRQHQTVLSCNTLQDPQIRRELMLRLRQQSVGDIGASNHVSSSRRSSRAVAAATRSRHSSVTSALLRQQANLNQHRKSTDTAISLGSGSCSRSTVAGRRRYTSGCPGEVPGIEISRIDTIDFDDGSLMATCSGKHGYGNGAKHRYSFVNSEGSSGDCSRLSFLGGGSSEYSLSASRSSRSRSSHDSTGSRVWDFSPRQSEWDVQGTTSGSSSSRAAGGNGPPVNGSGGLGLLDAGPGEQQSLLYPGIPRPGGGSRAATGCSSSQMVTCDINQPTGRRHSSPVSGARRRDSLIPVSSCTDYQLNGITAGINTNAGPRTSPTNFRSASISGVPHACGNLSDSAGTFGAKEVGNCSSNNNRYSMPTEEARSNTGGIASASSGGVSSQPAASAAMAAFRRKSCSGEQSLLSVTIDEADTDTENYENLVGVTDGGESTGTGNADEKTALINQVIGVSGSTADAAAEQAAILNSKMTSSNGAGAGSSCTGFCSDRRRSLKHNNSFISDTTTEVERRIAKLFDDMSYMSADELTKSSSKTTATTFNGIDIKGDGAGTGNGSMDSCSYNQTESK